MVHPWNQTIPGELAPMAADGLAPSIAWWSAAMALIM